MLEKSISGDVNCYEIAEFTFEGSNAEKLIISFNFMMKCLILSMNLLIQ